jgi:protein FAM32A
MDAYSSGGGGKLKLKGSKVSDGRVKKKKSKKSSSASTPGTEKEKDRDVSADLASQQEAAESRSRSREGSSAGRDDDEDQSHRESSATPAVKTEAERRHEEMRKKRVCCMHVFFCFPSLCSTTSRPLSTTGYGEGERTFVAFCSSICFFILLDYPWAVSQLSTSRNGDGHC